MCRNHRERMATCVWIAENACNNNGWIGESSVCAGTDTINISCCCPYTVWRSSTVHTVSSVKLEPKLPKICHERNHADPVVPKFSHWKKKMLDIQISRKQMSWNESHFTICWLIYGQQFKVILLPTYFLGQSIVDLVTVSHAGTSRPLSISVFSSRGQYVLFCSTSTYV